jgi:hypothetical protein
MFVIDFLATFNWFVVYLMILYQLHKLHILKLKDVMIIGEYMWILWDIHGLFQDYILSFTRRDEVKLRNASH